MKLLFFSFVLAVSILAQPAAPTKIDQQIISLTYNEQFTEAKKIAQEQLKSNPSSPKYYYYVTNIMLMEFYENVSELDPDKRDEGRKILNRKIITYCEGVVEKFEDVNLNTENKFYFGTIYAYLARVYGVDGSWWSAFRSGMKAKSAMEDVLKADPKFYDAYLIIGMLNYYADRMSGVTSLIAGILGFSGDREKGLNYLKIAYDKGIVALAQSTLTLIEVYANLEDNAIASIPFFESFLKSYPENKRVLNTYCHLLLNLWDVQRVESILKNDKQNLIENFIKARFYDALGNSEMAIKFGEAAFNQKSVIRSAENLTPYILAYNSWLTGDNARLKKYEPLLNERSKESITLSRKNPTEAKWLHNLFVKAVSDINVDEIETYVQTKPSFKNAEGLEVQFNLLLGQYYFNNNILDKAEQAFSKITNSENERDRYSALHFLLDIYTRQTVSKTKVKNLLSAIDDLDNTRLKFRANDLEKKYNL